MTRSYQNTVFKSAIYKIYTPTFTSLLLISAVYIASVFQFLLFSMGLARKMKLDEKGGAKSKKFLSRNFKKLLMDFV